MQLTDVELVEIECKQNYGVDFDDEKKLKIPVKISSWGKVIDDLEVGRLFRML